MVFPIASYTFLWRVLQEPPIQNHQQITQKASKKKNQKTNPVLLSLSMKKGVPENRKLSNTHTIQWRVPGGSDNLPVMWDTWVWSLSGEDPQEKEMATHSSHFLPEKSHGQRSLAGSSPWGHKADVTERLTLSLFILFKPNANGNIAPIPYFLWFWLGQVRLWSSMPPNSCPPEKAALWFPTRFATYSSILAGKIPWTEELVRHSWVTKHAHTHP